MPKNSHKWRRKNALSPRQCTVSQGDGKTTFELLPHPPYSPVLAPSDYWLSADLKRMIQGKKFGSIEEVISETEEYFEAQRQIVLKKKKIKKSIALLEKCWNQETMLMNKVEFCLKVVALLVRPGTYWVMCYICIFAYIFTLIYLKSGWLFAFMACYPCWVILCQV